MSGTSMDGVDLSIIKSDGNNEFIGILDNYFEFDQNLQQNLLVLEKNY
jgi:anhydro-N-acetylmuramic acid kinase